mmetsp:Transcript_25658/g.55468  ORF Transcript_25658/g.55468 Transcript_25658/m.55468 type:complete len:299 (-) Transcript_25658:1059-1955(-)
MLLCALEVLHVEGFDGPLLELERLLLALRDGIHHELQLLLGASHVGGVVLVQLESLLEGVTRACELIHPEEGRPLARVALSPGRLQPDAVLGIGKRLVVLLERHVGGGAVGVEYVVVGVKLDGLAQQVDRALVVLLVEVLDGALLALERLALARHLLGDGVHDGLELLLERVVDRVELESLLEAMLGHLELAHPEKDRAAPQVALGPVGLQPDALVGVLHGRVVLLERDVGRAPVGEEHVRLLVQGEGDGEVLDGALVVLGLEVVDGHLLERVDGSLDGGLGEKEHLLGVVDAVGHGE